MQSQKPWLAEYPDDIPHELPLPNQTLQSILTDSAARFPEKTAISFFGKKITFHDILTDALKLAAFLQCNGLQKGDRVAVMLPNCPQAVISYYGVLFAGGIVVQTNPLYTERELEYQLRDAEASVIITLDLLFPKAIKMKTLSIVDQILITSIKDYLPFPKNILYPLTKKQKVHVDFDKKANIHTFASSMKREKTELLTIPKIDPEHDIAVLQYTGGTTGAPKGVMLTHRNILANTEMCAAWMYDVKEGAEKVLGIVPFFHVYGLTAVMNYSIKQGFEMILLPKFDPLETLKIIDKQKPTLFPGAPTIYIGLLHHPDLKQYDLSSIKSCLSGSAALPVEVKQKFEKVTGGKLVEGYGLSEASPVTHANFIWGKNKPGSIGCPWPSTDAAIYSDETGEFAAPYEHGEIIVKGPQVMKGYWNKPEETAAVLRDGWLFTGDMGYMDEEGFFYIADRKKDIIIAGGYNIYPREVEEVLYEHEAIQEIVVAGVPDSYRGETVKAFVVLKKGEKANAEELDAFARSRLAPYKVPKAYEFRKELPKTAVGKILRRRLLEEEIENQHIK
ncbi:MULTISPECIES: long-chain-fatty-acid--CoA ligase LcfA [unclassified Bacillus (in: firmicutes)]|uniref:long-chain-fatty-acid--CoA ligase LcfA n=1 Tax=unclassified Bacillus (in: firmicutes) TaxID=185979 RepID=UPI00227EBC5C|nr:long-chain-fatty-acid--CoA ligase LcfA [Bacillus sp. S20C3]MCY8286913.1 long-chain-fatty-acid--CoA ligase LcfA [Bacillus sp. N13C7]MCY8637292.1 long-chain-fatty-acid--CoA ligase LcfA [Bacillus sp. S17B2]MCY8719721.1 long-chain-fatty-acid--CoA ligase LcfA [Bacillus sp. S10C12M]MCY9143643.1 long-chain-fatty-acid--CoA ligase LcfA [Bacillus sp. T9C1]